MNQNNSGFLNSIPPVTRNIIIINVIVWLAQILFAQKGIDLYKLFALHYFASPDFMPHQIITSMFMHATYTPTGQLYFTHILFNMFAVYMFGRTIESIWGGKKFLFYYLVTGVGAAILQLFVYFLRIKYLEAGLSADAIADIYQNGLAALNAGKNSVDPAMASIYSLVNGTMVGASGAVFGILVAFGMMFPDAKLMIIPIPIPVKAKWVVIGYGVLELTLGVANSSGDNVAHFAHLGGFITGFIILMIWRKSNRRYNDRLF